MQEMPNAQRHTELLAPAGSYECFKAAMNAGADAVYLGLDRFGARAGAVNLSGEELKEALDIAHIFGRKIYLTVNTLFRDDEIDELYDLLYEHYINGLDGVIVQDIGVMSYISRTFPGLPIHVSTQAAVTSSKAAALLRQFGVSRIVPARELSIDEIGKLKEETGLETECFIHGAMCYSYSGKCLLSSFIGGRSGNRGRCAQPCRLPYDGKHLLSLRDMCTLDILPELIDAGISSFKIEGRMKSSAYVYGVTSIYRKYMDMYRNGQPFHVEAADRRQLISLYTRSGNCEGYYHCHNDRKMITRGSGSYTSDASEDNDAGICDLPRIGVKMKCRICAGKNVIISAEGADTKAEISTDIIPEAAVNRALSTADVIKQLKRSGGTSFDVKDISVELDDGLFIANGSLNSVRRQGLDALNKKILEKYRRDVNDINRNNAIRPGSSYQSDMPRGNRAAEDMIKPEVNAAVINASQLACILRSEADGVIIPASLFDRTFIAGRMDANDKKIYIRLPYVIREEGLFNSSENIGRIIKKASEIPGVLGFYVSNAESLTILSECGYTGMIIGDIFLYAYNNYAYEHIRRAGITKTTVPVELNERELIRRGITGEELIIYGRLPVMISAGCIYNTKNGCQRSDKGHELHITDRKQEELFVHCNCNECTNVIYNSSILSVSDEKTIFDRLCPSSVRFEFTDEDPAIISALLDTYIKGRDNNGYTDFKLIDKYTKGHLKRGVK